MDPAPTTPSSAALLAGSTDWVFYLLAGNAILAAFETAGARTMALEGHWFQHLTAAALIAVGATAFLARHLGAPLRVPVQGVRRRYKRPESSSTAAPETSAVGKTVCRARTLAVPLPRAGRR